MAALKQRPCACQVALRIMVECHRQLDQSLEKLLLRRNGRAPYIFPSLVGFEEHAVIEEANCTEVQIVIQVLCPSTWERRKYHFS